MEEFTSCNKLDTPSFTTARKRLKSIAFPFKKDGFDMISFFSL